MKKSVVKNLIVPILVIVFAVATLSSCQRGYGCPYKMQAQVEVKK